MLQTKALTTGGYLKTPTVLPARGRCLASVQAGQLLSAKPNKQQPLELSTLWAHPDALSLDHDWVPHFGQALQTGLLGGFGVTTTF